MEAFMWGGGHFYLLETQGISEVCYDIEIYMMLVTCSVVEFLVTIQTG